MLHVRCERGPDPGKEFMRGSITDTLNLIR